MAFRQYLTKKLLFALGFVTAIYPTSASTPNAEMNAIVGQLGLAVPEKLITNQSAQLSPSFMQAFKTKSHLSSNRVSQYFSSNPNEVMAFRAYVQQLVNVDIVSPDKAEQLVIVAFQALEQVPHKETTEPLASVRRSDSENDYLGSNQTFELPEGSLKVPFQGGELEPSRPESVIDFGEKLEEEQQASIATENLAKKLEEQERIERNTQLARALIEEFSQGTPDSESIGRRVERVVSEFAEQEAQQQAESFLDNVEVSVASVRNGPEYSIRGLKAFEDLTRDYFSFMEFGLTSTDDDTTLNVGVGIRKISEDQTIMGGINAFYDQELDKNHRRASIGVELITAPLRFNANRYYAMSDGYKLNALQTEKPLSGHDIDVEAALPYFPGLFAGYNQAKWYGEDGVADIERKTYRLRGQLSQNLSVEIGQRRYSNNLEDQNTAQLSYNYVFGADAADPKLLDIDTQPYRPQELGPRERYRMVERENKIVTQVSQAGLIVTFTAL